MNKDDGIKLHAELTGPTLASPPAELAAKAKQYRADSLSKRTRQEYRADLKRFLAWGGSLPATPGMVSAYLSDHASSHAIATLRRWLSSIRKAHKAKHLDDPTQDEEVKRTFKGIRNRHGKPQRQVAAAMRDELVLMIRTLDESTRSVRNRALLLLGFAGAFRRSELVALEVRDLQFSEAGLTVTVLRSKTDQEGVGEVLGIPFARNARLCPVLAVKAWLAELPVDDVIESSDDNNTVPLFRKVDRHGNVGNTALNGRAVAELIKERCLKAGLDPAQYAGHSLRAGFCTAAALAGEPNWKIRKQSRHKSDVMLNRYIRDGRLFADNALEKLL